MSRCAKVTANWQKVAVTLAASREAKGMPRINVAQVDTSTSAWLRKRFGVQSVPVVLLRGPAGELCRARLRALEPHARAA